MSHQLWNTLIKHQISPNQLYLLDSCRYKIKPSHIINSQAEYNVCKAKGLILENGELSPKALQILEEFEVLLIKTKKKVAMSVLGTDFMEKIEEYRKIFPAIRLPSGSLARQSVQELKDKFVWFFKTYPNYNWDLVLDAAEYYVYLKSQKQYEFMSTSSYFIKKQDVNKNVTSQLADHCEMLIDNPNLLNI